MMVFAYMYVYAVWVQCPWRSKEGVKSPRTGVTCGCEPSIGCRELHLTLQKQQSSSATSLATSCSAVCLQADLKPEAHTDLEFMTFLPLPSMYRVF